MKGKKSFLLYCDMITLVESLPDEKAGQLLKIIFQYVNDQDPQVEDLLLKVAFEPIKLQLKRDLVQWKEFIEKQRLNGQKGGRPTVNQYNPKNPSLILANPKNPTNVTVTVTDKDNVTDTQNTTPTPKGEFDEFILSFNKITNRQYRGDEKTRRQFSARVKEGFKPHEILQATSNCLKDPYHIANPNYLTPEFITRTDKLQKYLNWIPPAAQISAPEKNDRQSLLKTLDNTPRR